MGRYLEEQFHKAEREGLYLLPGNEAERKALELRARSGEVGVPWPGMFARAAYLESLGYAPRTKARHVLRTYAKRHPGVVFCSFSAAVMHGLWVPKALVERIYTLSEPSGSSTRDVAARSRGASAKVVRRSCKGCSVVEVDGCHVTDIDSTLFECALASSLSQSLPMLDCALRYELTTKERLLKFAYRYGKGRHGKCRALEAVDYADGASENGGESTVRGLIIELGYVQPADLQVEFEDPVDFGKTIRVDGVWHLENGACVIEEVDGLDKYRDEASVTGWSLEAIVRERQRESHITALGYPVMRIQYARTGEEGYLEGLLRGFGIPKRVNAE